LEENMATRHATAPAGEGTSSRSTNSAFGFLVCCAVVALAMASLWVGLSGLLNPDHVGGLGRTLGGIVGFFAIFGLTLIAAARQK
jgi:uncharacterized membrane protein required for colicin V production